MWWISKLPNWDQINLFVKNSIGPWCGVQEQMPCKILISLGPRTIRVIPFKQKYLLQSWSWYLLTTLGSPKTFWLVVKRYSLLVKQTQRHRHVTVKRKQNTKCSTSIHSDEVMQLINFDGCNLQWQVFFFLEECQ